MLGEVGGLFGIVFSTLSFLLSSIVEHLANMEILMSLFVVKIKQNIMQNGRLEKLFTTM